ncbi:hypothetical protein LTR66_015405, partial [Elasticomyces elasticus]
MTNPPISSLEQPLKAHHTPNWYKSSPCITPVSTHHSANATKPKQNGQFGPDHRYPPVPKKHTTAGDTDRIGYAAWRGQYFDILGRKQTALQHRLYTNEGQIIRTASFKWDYGVIVAVVAADDHWGPGYEHTNEEEYDGAHDDCVELSGSEYGRDICGSPEPWAAEEDEELECEHGYGHEHEHEHGHGHDRRNVDVRASTAGTPSSVHSDHGGHGQISEWQDGVRTPSYHAFDGLKVPFRKSMAQCAPLPHFTYFELDLNDERDWSSANAQAVNERVNEARDVKAKKRQKQGQHRGDVQASRKMQRDAGASAR